MCNGSKNICKLETFFIDFISNKMYLLNLHVIFSVIWVINFTLNEKEDDTTVNMYYFIYLFALDLQVQYLDTLSSRASWNYNPPLLGKGFI